VAKKYSCKVSTLVNQVVDVILDQPFPENKWSNKKQLIVICSSLFPNLCFDLIWFVLNETLKHNGSKVFTNMLKK